ncbi:hypothetical protein Aab01nite_78890 [Paractinoplanes abujensis]|uniref:DUF4367 domain-containing protein n=1 Tax=Paractinoplanes abujensis TaxID=882441 RepID=A0A7W7CPB8_9ACTN|nr:hypothetical protein [Actinoplanes abujensis]MBB4692221.1 hypothetical protein [Actinoplanes abujensis]GID24299.1 hypothetical protein Aab01nite_78890 [Actinoplanes abujensis]
MTLEDDLRTTLQDRAARPASRPDPDLWENVAAGVWRRRRRQRAGAIGAAALALTAVVVVPPLLTKSSAAPIPATSVPPTTDWVAPAWPPVVFPMRPSWVPPDPGTRSVMLIGPNHHLSYEREGSILSAEVGPVTGSWEVEAESTHRSTVNGRAAEVHVSSTYDGAGPGDEFVGVRWRLSDGQWAQVLSMGPRKEPEVLRFARGLTAGSVAAAPPSFKFAAVPPGFTLQHESDNYMCVAPAATVSRDGSPGDGVCVQVLSERETPAEPPIVTTVNGRRAEFSTSTLTIELGKHRWLELAWEHGTTRLSSDDIVRLASGITVRS